jgi:hypothetical protein
MRRSFPFYGFVGIFLLILSEILLFRKVQPFYTWFYSFAWWSYILAVDGLVYRLKGRSLILHRTREFFLMIPWSVFIWLIFEAANLSLENWYYINLPPSAAERWLGYALAYGTVLPALFETTELLGALGLFNRARIRKLSVSSRGRDVLVLLGALFLALSVLFPVYFFPLIWVAFAFLLEPFNYQFGQHSLLKDLAEGDPRRICRLLVAGLICGGLWEFWNHWARAKWIYTVPFFDETKAFEMPLLGFLGFPPFAVEAYVMYQFVSLFQSQRGWEASAYHPNLRKKAGTLRSFLLAILITAFAILIFMAIDIKTVNSYEPRLQDAYWIDPKYREELPKAGVPTLQALVSRTNERKDVEELALRLLVPKEELQRWVTTARIAETKGIGIGNLRLLEGAGVDSLEMLAREDPERLRKRMEGVFGPENVPGRARLRIWIKEAKRQVISDH